MAVSSLDPWIENSWVLVVQKECLFATAGSALSLGQPLAVSYQLPEKVCSDLPPSSTFTSSRIQICDSGCQISEFVFPTPYPGLQTLGFRC